MASLTFSLTCFPSSNFSKTSLRGFPRFPVTSVGNSGSMGTMICCKLAQRASLNMIRRIDLLTEILFVRDRFSQILCETYTIVFGFSASMSTTTPSPAQIQKMDRLCFEKMDLLDLFFGSSTVLASLQVHLFYPIGLTWSLLLSNLIVTWAYMLAHAGSPHALARCTGVVLEKGACTLFYLIYLYIPIYYICVQNKTINQNGSRARFCHCKNTQHEQFFPNSFSSALRLLQTRVCASQLWL